MSSQITLAERIARIEGHLWPEPAAAVEAPLAPAPAASYEELLNAAESFLRHLTDDARGIAGTELLHAIRHHGARAKDAQAPIAFQILRYQPGPEAFCFVRNNAREIQQWSSFDAAADAVKTLIEPDGVEHVIVTVHRCFKVTTTYQPSEATREIKEYGIGRLASDPGRERA